MCTRSEFDDVWNSLPDFAQRPGTSHTIAWGSHSLRYGSHALERTEARPGSSEYAQPVSWRELGVYNAASLLGLIAFNYQVALPRSLHEYAASLQEIYQRQDPENTLDPFRNATAQGLLRLELSSVGMIFKVWDSEDSVAAALVSHSASDPLSWLAPVPGDPAASKEALLSFVLSESGRLGRSPDSFALPVFHLPPSLTSLKGLSPAVSLQRQS